VYTLGYQTTTTLGQTATDQYTYSFTYTFDPSFFDFVKVNFTSTSTLTDTSSWGHESTQSQGQSAKASITGPKSCTYSGPIQVQVYRDNVYGSFCVQLVLILGIETAESRQQGGNREIDCHPVFCSDEIRQRN
jgi:hypothetical protein